MSQMRVDDLEVSTEPRVTIAIVVKNGAETIERTLRSVIQQAFPAKEIIVVDGGSTDGTVERVKRFGGAVDVLVSEADDGVYFAMNKAISIAGGSHILFMNAGDEFASRTVLSAALASGVLAQADFIVGRYRRVAPLFSRIVDPLDPNWRLSLIASGQISRAIRRLPCHQATIGRLSALRRLGGYNTRFRVLADQELLIRATAAGMLMQKSDVVFCNYRTGGLSSDVTASQAEMREILIGFGCEPESVNVALEQVGWSVLIRWIERLGQTSTSD